MKTLISIGLVILSVATTAAEANPEFVPIVGISGPIHWSKQVVSYSFSSNTPEFVQPAFQAAFGQWSKTLHKAIVFIKETQNADISIAWTGNANPAAISSVALISDEKSSIVKAKISINATNFSFHTGEPYFPDLENNEINIDGVALRTIGESLGLSEFDVGSPEKIGPPWDTPCMYRLLGPWSIYLHADDVAGILSIYGPVFNIQASDYQAVTTTLSKAGISYTVQNKFKVPRQLKGLSLSALKSGSNTLYFDSEENFVGMLSGSKFIDRIDVKK